MNVDTSRAAKAIIQNRASRAVTTAPAPPRTVLIVESQPILKLCIAELVETSGFAVVEARDADEAMSILESRIDIGLIVTNVVMQSNMDGAALAHAVDERWPTIKVIVVSGKSGLSEDDLPRKSLFLAKPFYENELIFEIRAFIDL